MKRFENIFQTNFDKSFVVGNHDIGLDIIKQDVVKRYEKYFGKLFYTFSIDGFQYIIINSLQIEGSNIDKDAQKFIKEFKKNEQERILFTHIPLHRGDFEKCSKESDLLRSRKFDHGRGMDYQNMLSPQTSLEILKHIDPIHIFSGDDHEPCEYKHERATENTVPTFSWLQGTSKPGFGMFTTNNETRQVFYNDCFTPRQTYIYLWYAICFGLTLLLMMPISMYLYYSESGNQFLSLEKKNDEIYDLSALDVIKSICYLSIKSLYPCLFVLIFELSLYLLNLWRWSLI